MSVEAEQTELGRGLVAGPPERQVVQAVPQAGAVPTDPLVSCGPGRDWAVAGGIVAGPNLTGHTSPRGHTQGDLNGRGAAQSGEMTREDKDSLGQGWAAAAGGGTVLPRLGEPCRTQLLGDSCRDLAGCVTGPSDRAQSAAVLL